MIPVGSSVEVLKFLDSGSREALRLVCSAFNQLFVAHFGRSPPIRGIRLQIWVAESTISCKLFCAKNEKVPDYFRYFRYGDAWDSGEERVYCFRLRGKEDFEGVLLDHNISIAKNVLLRILASEPGVSVRRIHIGIRKHRLATEESIFSILFHWRRLWADTVIPRLSCDYADAFASGNDFSGFNRLVSTLPASVSLAIFNVPMAEPVTIHYATLFGNIYNYLKVEHRRVAYSKFELTINVEPEGGEALLEAGLKEFSGRLVEFFVSLTHKVGWEIELFWKAPIKASRTIQRQFQNPITNQTLSMFRITSDRYPSRNYFHITV